MFLIVYLSIFNFFGEFHSRRRTAVQSRSGRRRRRSSRRRRRQGLIFHHRFFLYLPLPRFLGGDLVTQPPPSTQASVLRNKGLNNIREGVWEKGSIEVRNMSLISDKLHAVFHVKVLRNSAHALLSLRMLDCSCEKDSLQFSTT